MIEYRSKIYAQITAFLNGCCKDTGLKVYNMMFQNANIKDVERVEFYISNIRPLGINTTTRDASGSSLIFKNYPYFNFTLKIRVIADKKTENNIIDSILSKSRSTYLLDYFFPDIDYQGWDIELLENERFVSGELVKTRDIIVGCTVQAECEVDADDFSGWFSTYSVDVHEEI